MKPRFARRPSLPVSPTPEATMRSSMKHWKQLVLLGMLAWAFFFLALFAYFLDSHGMAAVFHVESQRLAPPQGRPRAIMGSRPQSGPGEAKSPEETEGGAYPELQTRESLLAINDYPEGLRAQDQSQEEEEKPQRDIQQNSRTFKRWHRERHLGDYYFSKSRTVLQGLWKGSISAQMLSPRLQSAMREYMMANKHHVAYRGRRNAELRGSELLCELKKRVQVRALDGREEPFSQLGWGRLVPIRPLEQMFASKFRTCAVVTSAGAILNSALGDEIDSHDAVLRFNAAPTDGYEDDVGNKTSIRIVNSQILANPKHQFDTSALYKDVALVAWDPAPYAVDLVKWYQNPDYNLFKPYVERLKTKPKQPFYILHPKFIWQMWDLIQANMQESIQPNPPSSGFIGIFLMMALCEKVHVYEYIPSMRQTDLCHYYEQYYDSACTLGAYHPLLYEKVLVARLNVGSELDLQRKGRITLPGFSTVTCDP
ncbi:beta-galactoside alpha-2,6-sialyltransferase 2 isoform X1 [Paramormyrops kingsleyae]|uniref:Beta-galactoside alpha-2,6-sialyltransferase 2 n=2 Tax=Paramormyrops kingsleyae TaxID=1676925 RepID=A0A3B3SET8_9TELE|nr:beta-galactoside alpha-2,6-sialyltransferase 2 isoform X1 [Paramormyrops kingsleyae]